MRSGQRRVPEEKVEGQRARRQVALHQVQRLARFGLDWNECAVEPSSVSRQPEGYARGQYGQGEDDPAVSIDESPPGSEQFRPGRWAAPRDPPRAAVEPRRP
jgi:hypothetical protein